MANDGIVKIGAEVDEKEFSSSLSKLGGVAKGAMVGVTAAIGSAAAAVGKLAKDSVEAYASYEQLTGGVETLFKESSDLVMKYANNAYQTAGLSANQYMETVTSFSASLLQGLGGDTEAAATMADLAITDMSDNANKMGTDMSSIQNAYQGFAKQNYTMLDNLKLGYGGTQAEMARLINDSGVLGGTMEVTANTVNQVSFDKIIEAIHVVQTQMGITGTTAEEAATTIDGSVNSMKAAWENFITGMADGDQDIGQLTDNLVDSVITVMDNLVPRLQELLPRLAEGFAQLIQGLLPYIPGILETLLPALIDGAASLAESFAQVLPSIVMAITNALPQLMDAAVQIISALAQGLIDALPVLIPAVVQVMLDLVDLLTDPDNLSAIIDAALQIIIALGEGLLAAIPQLIERVPQIIASIVQALIGAIPDILVAGARLGAALIDGIIDSVKVGYGALSEVIHNARDSVKNGTKEIFGDGLASDVLSYLTDSLLGPIEEAYNTVSGIFSGIGAVFSGDFEKAGNAIKDIVDGWSSYFDTVFDDILNIFSDVAEFFGVGEDVINAFVDGVESAWNSLKQGIADMIQGFVNGLKDMIQGFVDWAEGIARTISGWFSGGSSFGGGGNRGGTSASMSRAATAAESEPAAFSLAAEDGTSAAVMSRASMLRSLESAIPAAAGRVSVATASMAPAAAWSAPPPVSSGGNPGNGQPVQIIDRRPIVIKAEGDLAPLARLFKPALDAEDIRVGNGV